MNENASFLWIDLCKMCESNAFAVYAVCTPALQIHCIMNCLKSSVQNEENVIRSVDM